MDIENVLGFVYTKIDWGLEVSNFTGGTAGNLAPQIRPINSDVTKRVDIDWLLLALEVEMATQTAALSKRHDKCTERENGGSHHGCRGL